MASRLAGRKGFMTRLLRNEAGNVLVLTAAATIPLIGIVGSAVDISRAYLTRTRLQQACDAGVLAGRKSMEGITWTSANRQTAEQFFHMNFPDGKYGTTPPDVDFSATNSGAVNGTAGAGVPMTLMSLFNMPTLNISVSCAADLQLPNTDIMFVLDTTLSMNDANPGDSQSRIAVLRDSVTDFYDTLEDVRPAGSVIRYGFVPYSGTVNVGMLLKPEWLQSNPVYDSRVEDGRSTQIITNTTGGGTYPDTITSWTAWTGGDGTTSTYPGPSENCVAPTNNLTTKTTQSAWSPNSSALPRSRTHTRTRNGNTYSAKFSNGVCTITQVSYANVIDTRTETIDKHPNAGEPIPSETTTTTKTHYHWIYKPVAYDIANLKGANANGYVTGGSFTAPVANANTSKDIHPVNRTITWNQNNGCIEERGTRRPDDPTSVVAYDMNIDLVPDPTKPETQWKPYLPGVVYGRDQTTTGYQRPVLTGTRYPAAWLNRWEYSASPETRTRDVNINATTNYFTPSSDLTQPGACPTYARKLQATTRGTLVNYLNDLTPAGFTYHDIGMMWGLRLMSRDGLFATENRAAEASGRIARHLIFMTDGDTDTRIGAYDAWGISAMTRRRTAINAVPTDEAQNTLTETRLSTLCTAAKNQKNITVWVIAFGTDLTTMLSDCASPNRAYQADNAAELMATFSEIASQIAQLRITR
ncbi:MAG: pilus assembly protein TadG-related protein [Sphingobium sp.]